MTEIDITKEAPVAGKTAASAPALMPSTADLSYNSFFGLEETPFSISPNPRFLYMSEQHQEALAHLLYGVSASNGFVLLTGEVGTGKTTVIRTFLQHLPEDARVAYIVHAKLSACELLETIIEELNIDISADASQRAMIGAIHQKLLENFASGFRTFLLIDEAQNLSVSVLEEIRLLTNLETDEGKLLHIILVGQPELRSMFQAQGLRQLNQRITARYHLRQLSNEDVILYLQHRLAVAHASRNPFTIKAMKSLAKYSGGVPRLLNILSDRALLAGFAKNQVEIDHHLVKASAREVFGGVPLGGQLRQRLSAIVSQFLVKTKTDQDSAVAHLGFGAKSVLVLLTLCIMAIVLIPQFLERSVISASSSQSVVVKDVEARALTSALTIKKDEATKQEGATELSVEGSIANADTTEIVSSHIHMSAVEPALESLNVSKSDGARDNRTINNKTINNDADLTNKEHANLSKPADVVLAESMPLVKGTSFEDALLLSLQGRGIQLTSILSARIEAEGCAALPGKLGCLTLETPLNSLVQLDTPFLFQLSPGQLRSLGIEFDPDGEQGLTRFIWFLARRVDSNANEIMVLSKDWSGVMAIQDLNRVFLGRAHLVLQTPVDTMPKNKPLGVEYAGWIIGHIGFSGGAALDPLYDVVISEPTLNAAVKAFQKQRGLVSDGLFGVRTLVELNRMIDSQFPTLAVETLTGLRVN